MSSARPRSAERGARGSSLLEALATMGLLGIMMVGFTANTVSLTRASKTADSVSAANALAQEKLELLRSLPLGAAQLAPGTYTDATSLQADGTPGTYFTRSWTVSPKDTPRFGVKTVTVQVAWTDSQSHVTKIAGYVRCSTVPCP